MKTDITFLDFRIVNSGNSDGNVLLGNVPGEHITESHLGNYGTVEEAKKFAVIYYMIFRPRIFSANIANRALGGRGHWGDFFKLQRMIEADELEMPEEITKSDDGNCGIHFLGEPLK